MAKTLLKVNNKAIATDGKLVMGAVEQVIPEGYIKPSGKIEITTTDEIDVSQYAKAQVIDSNLEPQNIAKDVTILGVTGTLEAGGGGSEDLLEALLNDTITSYSNSNITSVKEKLFNNNKKLESVSLPSATSIGSSAFSNCTALKSVDLPNAKIISSWVFSNCSALESVSLPSATSIDYNTFNNCTALKSVDLPNVTNVGSSPFNNCTALTEIDLPSATSLGNSAFVECENLISVNIPLVTSIGNNAFQRCYSLNDIYLGYDGIVSLTSTGAFNNAGTKQGYVNVHVRSEYADQYATATNWSSLIANGTIVIVGDYSD